MGLLLNLFVFPLILILRGQVVQITQAFMEQNLTPIFFIGNGVSQDVPCAVCRVIDASSVIMIPGKNKCYNGWNMEYHGYLAANNNNLASAGSYTCIDMNPEVLRGGSANDNVKLFFEVLAKCGSLQCPPYIQNYPLTCVVCSK